MVTEIRCYSTDCKHNNYKLANCGYCKLSSIAMRKASCYDFEHRKELPAQDIKLVKRTRCRPDGNKKKLIGSDS